MKEGVPRPGDILLFCHAQGINRIITWFSGSPFYHVGLYAGDHCVIEARVPGVVRRDLREGKERDYILIPAPEDRGAIALEWAKNQVSEDYAVLGVGVLILDELLTRWNFSYTRPGHWTCGQFVARAFEKAGVDLFSGRKPAGVTPWDFARLRPDLVSAKPDSEF